MPEYIDLRQYDHQTALDRSKKEIDKVPGKRNIIVDLDGPILESQGFRLGLSEGNLQSGEIEFLRGLTGETSNNVIVYSSRPLWGVYAQFWNSVGSTIERIKKSLSLPADRKETYLHRQLREIGVSPENIFYPKGLEAIFFPFYKWDDLIRLELGKTISLFGNINSDAAIIYMGDTKADRMIFQQLIAKLPGKQKPVSKFLQFRSSFPGGIF